MLQDLRGKFSEDDGEGAKTALKVLDALEAEFRGKTLRQSAEHLGLPGVGVGAVYGIGPLPVARVQLADPARLDAFIDRLQNAAGFELVKQQIAGAHYWTLPVSAGAPPMLPLLAVVGDHLLLAVQPKAGGEPLLRQLLGLDKPARSQADGGEFARRAGELGFLPYAVGYVDSLRLFQQAIDPARPASASLWQALDKSVPQLDETCRREIEDIVGQFPGISLGMSRFDAQGNSVRSVLHIAPEIAAELVKLRAPMPGGDPASDDAIASFGVAFSLQALPGVVSRLAARITEAPYACDDLAPLNAAAAEAAKGINNPAVFAAAPMVFGLAASLDRFDYTPDSTAPQAEGTLLLGGDNPQSLVGMAKGLVPQLAQLEVPNDGTPVKLPALPGSPPGTPELMVAQSDRLLGLATVESAGKLSSRLKLDPEYQPLLAARVRPRMYQLIADAMQRIAVEMPDSADKEQIQLQIRLMRESYAKAFSQATFSIEFSERGLEVVQAMETR
jgi:hypothetical protein